MSVDKQRETHHINRVAPSDLGLLMSAQSYRPEITQAIRKIKSFPWEPLQSLVKNVISPGPHPAYGGTYPCLKTKNVNELLADLEPADFANVKGIGNLEKVQVERGDLLINLTGAGSIGRVSIYYGDDLPITNQHIARMGIKDAYDEGYVAAFLRSWWGERALEQGVAGSTGQINMVNDHVRSIPVILFNAAAQKYIGDKVRQAERLRAWAKARGTAIGTLVSDAAMKSACATTEKQHNRPQLEDLSHRLDPKYYGNRAVAVFRQAKALGKSLSSLVKGIANGFEERVFFDSGRDYITVTEVSSGRLDLSSAPKIAHTTEVPDKAIIHERCALVVRTGSIGTAVKVDARDRGAVISSHLIRLEFEDEAIAAAVAAYLCSPAGKVLQHKISYGAVQPQIGQDELLALPIPQFVLDAKEQILTLVTEQESAIRASKSLTAVARGLIEDLIEGQITEAQLVAAEQALQAGNDALDRKILGRLTTDGIDGEGASLFSDLDEFYRLLALAEVE